MNAPQSGSSYLQDVLGDVLAKALSSVARERPQDPIQYVADYLHNVTAEENRHIKHETAVSEEGDDSGHFEERSNSNIGSSLDTINLDHNNKRHESEGEHFDRLPEAANYTDRHEYKWVNNV